MTERIRVGYPPPRSAYGLRGAAWLPVQITLFPGGVRDATARLCDVTWPPAWTPIASPAKLAAPLYIPGVATGWADDDVTCLWWGVIDIDHQDPRPVFQRLHATPYTWHAHTTYSHTPDDPGWRVILPFTRAVNAADWSLVWSGLYTLCDVVEPDSRCRNVGRRYFVPSSPKGNNQLYTHPGDPLDPFALPRRPPKAPRHEIPLAAIDSSQLLTLGRKLEKRADMWDRVNGAALVHLAKGEPFATEGDRDNALWRIALLCARELPWADPTSLAKLAMPSLQIMGAGAPDYDNALSKFTRAHADQQVIIATNQQEIDALTFARRKAAWRMIGVDDSRTYIDSDIAYLCQRDGCTPDELHRRWLIKCRKALYVRVADQYIGPFTEDEGINATDECLAVAAPYVKITKSLPDGTMGFRPFTHVMRDYGTIARNIEADLLAKQTEYYPATATIVEAPCKRRPIEPKYNAKVDQWLRILAGPKYDLLCAWISHLPSLHDPLVALFLHGAGGTGKSLLANGLARIWAEHITMLEDAMASFNDTVFRCPIWFGDEYLPKDYRGHVRTDELRRLIQARNLELKRKFLPATRVRGSPRLIVAANNDSIFGNTGHMTENDVKAFAERFLCITVSEESRYFLAKVQHKDWGVDGDVLAAHALKLAEQPAKAVGRFLVRDSDDTLVRVLSTRSGARFTVLAWCVRYLLDPVPANNATRGKGFLVAADTLYVNPRYIAECWSLYVKDAVPSSAAISQAVRGLQCGREGRLYAIKRDMLFDWAEDNGEASREDIMRALRSPPTLAQPRNNVVDIFRRDAFNE